MQSENHFSALDEVLTRPTIVTPVDAIFYFRRRLDPFLNANPQQMEAIIKILADHCGDRREPRSFLRAYQSFQSINGKVAVVNSMDELRDTMIALNPRILIIYSLLCGNYVDGSSQGILSRMYKDVSANSMLTYLPELLQVSKDLENKPPIIVVHEEHVSKTQLSKEVHMRTVEQMVINKLIRQYGKAITILPERDTLGIAKRVNFALAEGRFPS
jgi:CRISPR/Cas system Type II protein with McrA/HNH and RuvC-like nuclease domain